ncbi:MAG: biotin--[acetyl-CoA-carboxylase] ligase [Lactobacillaceae bacterium]|jgi:BirA family biotin operon repressor/biotin-[acetyl-CoA-carboxylase] ligase|nr:biotin--[acetyl-CoA-carboxylase] ligase [Lactobacillaceae bacterium]
MAYIEDWYWEDFEEVESTNDVAKSFAEGFNEKFVITAKKQLNGRGRRGRGWISINGNLFASFGIKLEARYVGVLSFIVSLSVLDAVKSFNNEIDVKLKWPNDVLVNGRKVSGILIERAGEYFVVGAGVNIVDYPENVDLLYEAISLKSVNIQTDSIGMLKLIVNRIDYYLAQWKLYGFEEIKNKWLKYAKNLGQKIIIRFEDGEKEGIFAGVDDNGYLLLNVEGSQEKVYAGDVFYI